jgi:phosphoribosylanthranilate isomerase
MFVKICGITSESDALMAIGLGADALGFVFAPSSRQMAVRAVARIVDRLPREILTVGVFRDESATRIVQIINETGLQAAQLHGNESIDTCRYVAERVPVSIKAFSAGNDHISRWKEYGVNFVMIDSHSPGSGQVFDWQLAEDISNMDRVILAGGLSPSNVAAAIDHFHPSGVDVSSGVESAPGRKDPNKIREFIRAARHGESGYHHENSHHENSHPTSAEVDFDSTALEGGTEDMVHSGNSGSGSGNIAYSDDYTAGDVKGSRVIFNWEDDYEDGS